MHMAYVLGCLMVDRSHADFLDISAQVKLELPTSSTIQLAPSTSPTTSTVRHGSCLRRRLCSNLVYTQAKYYLHLFFTTSVYFRRPPRISRVSMTLADPLYMLLSTLLIPPRHARGLGLANM
jgi:hypothetical protein